MDARLDNASQSFRDRVYVRFAWQGGGYNLVARVSRTLGHYEALVDEVMAHHAPSGSSTFIIGPVSASPALLQTLSDRGYRTNGRSDNWTINVDAHRPPMPSNIVVKRVDNLRKMKDMDRVMRACFGTSSPTAEAKLQRDLKACLGPKARCRRYIAYDTETGEAISTGAMNIFSTLGLGFMWGGSTIEAARGRGVYSALVTARMADARRAGLSRLGVHAMRASSAPIIQRQGFVRHGPIDYFEA